MIPKNLCTANSWLSVRSALFADSASTSPQRLIQNVLGTTRKFLRGFFRDKSELPTEITRKQFRLPVEFKKHQGGPATAPKLNLISYRPGNIYKVTSRWCSNSLTNSWRKELLRKFYRGGSGPMICFVGFALAKKPSLLTDEEEVEQGVSYLIRETFSSVPWKGHDLNIDKNGIWSNITLADLKFGELIAKGCNAVIYSASLNQPTIKSVTSGKQSDGVVLEEGNILSKSKCIISSAEDEQIPGLRISDEMTESKQAVKKNDDLFNSHFFISHSEGNLSTDNLTCKKDVSFPTGTFNSNDIAVKVMFNYSAESNAFAIFNSMYKETLPAMCEFSLGDMWKHKVRKKKLRPHPNIIQMYSAFADQLPLLPGAFTNYPHALPSRLSNDGCGRNMTLFLVMKRYHCCLKDYLQSQNPSSETALLLFTQLLEAIVHLFQSGIAHRDLKSDNILLDLSQGEFSPRLVLADFGCCSESLKLPYTSEDIPKGGNIALMAPEVINTQPISVIDYSRADLWAAGAIAYEIYGGSNPFYSKCNINNCSYELKDLPPFPTKAPPAIQKLVMQILSVNPNQRPTPNFAATVCQVLLHAPSKMLNGPFDATTGKKALQWMCQLSAMTLLEASVGKAETASVTFELCHTFCSRIQCLEIIQALQYILEP